MRSGREWQCRNRKDVFSGEPQDRAAGDQAGQARAAGEQVHHGGCGVNDLLEVVQDEQGWLVAEGAGNVLQQRVSPTFAHAQRLGDGGQCEGGIGKRGEGHEPDSAGEALLQLCGNADGKACLAHAARASQGQ